MSGLRICAGVLALLGTATCCWGAQPTPATSNTVAKAAPVSTTAAPSTGHTGNGKKTAKPMKLAPVTVQGKRFVIERLQTDKEALRTLRQVPGGTGMVTQEHIERRTAANISEVLDFVPGVISGQRQGVEEESQISIRGSGQENTYQLWGLNLLQDGFSLNQADGFAYMQPIDMMFTQRVEVYKGANALRFGGNSLGGAINLVSKTGYDTPILESSSTFGSFGYMKNYVGSGQVIGPWDYYLGVSVSQQGGQRPHSNSIQTRVFPSLGYAFANGTTVRFDSNYMHNDEKLPGSLTLQQLNSNPHQVNLTYLQQGAMRRYDYLRTGITVTKPIDADHILELYTQFIWHDLDHSPVYAWLQGSTYNWNNEVRYVSIAPLFEHQNKLTCGIQLGGTTYKDLEYQDNSGHQGFNLRNQWDRALTVGMYAEDNFYLTRDLQLVWGGRMDYSHRSIVGHSAPALADPTGGTDFFSGFSPKVGVIYQLMPEAQLFGNISRAYQPPILIEESQPLNQKSSLGGLDAEKAWQFELGTRGALNERFHWDLSVYDYEIWDELQNVNILPFPGAPFTIPAYDNIGRSRHTGIELGGDVVTIENLARALGLGAENDHLDARVAYTWSYFRFVDNPKYGSNQIPGITPENYIHSEVVYNHQSGFWLEPYVDAVPTPWAVNSANTTYAPSYVLLGMRVGYEIKRLHSKVFFEARNLTNATWVSAIQADDGNKQYFLPGDGRSFYGGLSFSF